MAERVLVDYQGPWGLGDLLCSEPMLRALAAEHGPGAEIRYAGNAGNAAFAPQMSGCASPSFVPTRRVDVRLFTHMPRADFAALEALPSLVDHMASYAGIAPPDRNPRLNLGAREHALVTAFDPGGIRRPIVAICADGSDAYRAWPVERFRALALRAHARGASVLELGTRERLGVGLDFVGRLDVRASAAILSTADLFVGNNSGLMHYAQAADVPVLAFFSLALPERFVHDDRLVVAVQRDDLACIDCMTRDSAKRNLAGCETIPEAQCMSGLPLVAGLAALDELFDDYLADRRDSGAEGPRARAYRARVYERCAARLDARGHSARAAGFRSFAQARAGSILTPAAVSTHA